MITLALLDQEVARRTGPYFQAAQDGGVPTSSTAIAAYMQTLKSSAVLGGPENLWLLRRGVHLNGSPLTPGTYDPVDRIRMVQTFDSSAGRVVVDRNWQNPMQPNELAEFTHLHPDQELRVSVLAGLRRCFVADRGRVYPNLPGGQVDLTEIQPWITSTDQIRAVQAGYSNANTDLPYNAVMQGGHVLLAWPTPSAPSGMWVTALRPAWTWVNDAESTTGPTLDTDELDVDLDYAAAAGHIAAWHQFPAHLYAAAAGNFQATQEMAAREFTRQALIWGPPPMRTIRFNEVVRLPI